ncbi:MAG: hypothetical protein ABSG86_30755 [Thermoguttaceae bacterium]
MTMNRALEAAAQAAHAAGKTWAEFWQQHGADVAVAEPWDRRRYHRLVGRLLALVVSGDTDGQEPVGDTMPWEADDCASPTLSDRQTRARCLCTPTQEVTI